MNVWYKSELPSHYNYGTNDRIEKIIVESDSAWGISLLQRSRGYSAGTHGYDPMNKDMHGIFYAMGPAFKQGFTHPSFQNINLYPLLAELLNLEPAQTDGNLITVQSLLVSEK